MITHRSQLTTGLRTACLLTLFLLTLTSISPARQLTSAGVPAAVKDLKDNDVGISLVLLQPNVLQQSKIVTAAQVNGTWECRCGTSSRGTIRILALGKQRLKVEFIGNYFYKLPDGTRGANDATGQSIAIIEGNEATFKPDEAEGECLITMKFVSNTLQVKQRGTCGFGLNVSLAGTYRRVSSRRPRFEFDDLNEPNDKPF